MTKRFQVSDNRDNPFLCDWSVTDYAGGGIVHHPMTSGNTANVMCELLNELYEENEQLKIALKDKENLISICEKKFKELGYLITCDDNGYVIE